MFLALAPLAPAADPPKPYAGRSASEREKLLLANGGTKESEAAVARGLKWLADNQVKTTGAWVFDGTSRAEVVAATGMGVLPFLAAGHTHKKGDKDKPNPFQKNVEAGLKFLTASQLPTGTFRGSNTMYAHAIATLALCEAYSMTADKTLLAPARAAVAYIVRGQAADGSWGYSAGTKGDTSILGWQLQALHAAKQTKDIPVPDGTIKLAKEFLDKVGKGDKKAEYGYTSNESPTPTLSAVGLWSRYCFDGWDAEHAGFDEGAKRVVLRANRPTEGREDSYSYYYVTLVARSRGGEVWEKDWNPKVRDLLVKKQSPEADGPRTAGSWPADKAYIGTHCGRIGTTAMTLLTLQVYYRVPPPVPVPPAKK
jgi:squalene cyclase